MSKNETYRYHYRFGLVSENMWNAEQYLASALLRYRIQKIIHGLKFNQISIITDHTY